MAQYLYNFLRKEDGQDLVEYSLLMMFIAMATLAFVSSGHTAVNGIWSTSDSQLSVANTLAGS